MVQWESGQAWLLHALEWGNNVRIRSALTEGDNLGWPVTVCIDYKEMVTEEQSKVWVRIVLDCFLENQVRWASFTTNS